MKVNFSNHLFYVHQKKILSRNTILSNISSNYSTSLRHKFRNVSLSCRNRWKKLQCELMQFADSYASIDIKILWNTWLCFIRYMHLIENAWFAICSQYNNEMHHCSYIWHRRSLNYYSEVSQKINLIIWRLISTK